MTEATEKIRSVVRHLILEGLEVSITTVQDMLKGTSISVQDEQVAAIVKEEGGPFPLYRGSK